MNLLQELLFLIADSPLMEMAIERKNALSEIRNYQYKLNEHLIKCFYYNNRARDHWIIEIITYLKRIDNLYLKPKNVKLSADDYFKILYDEPFGHGTQIIVKQLKLLKNDYKTCTKFGLDEEQIRHSLFDFYNTICIEFEKDIFIDNLDKNPKYITQLLDNIIKNNL